MNIFQVKIQGKEDDFKVLYSGKGVDNIRISIRETTLSIRFSSMETLMTWKRKGKALFTKFVY